MPRPITLHIPQPCAESWAAMTPASAGRHCAACEKTVVDFTQQTDAEILAYLAGAAGGGTCGRFAAEQLARPLQPTIAATPTRWRAWLAAAVAVWGLREAGSEAANAQVPMGMRPLNQPAFVPAQFRADKSKREHEAKPAAPDTVVIRGVVRDSATHDGLPGVTVLVKNSTIGVSTDQEGRFEVSVPAEYAVSGVVDLQITSIGFMTERRQIAATTDAQVLQVLMQADVRMLAGEVVIINYHSKWPPAPWRPRRLYNWGKYWATKPFRRG